MRGYRYRSPLRNVADGVTLWDMGSMGLLPQILGNADPMHYTQMLPGIQTNSEYRSGINIEGCDNQHNTISIFGTPIYNVNHLLGFFSAFNTGHFSSMSIAKGTVSACSPNRLGGQLDMLPPTAVADTVSGSFSVGLIASQGTVMLPVARNTSLNVSLRGSYVNLLYSQWMKADGQQVEYSFYDANLSLVHRPNDRHALLFHFYSGSDKAIFEEGQYLADMEARWGNTMGAVHWLYDDGQMAAHTSAYITAYSNKFSLAMQDMSFRLPSGIADFALRSSLSWKGWETGAEAVWHDIRPQALEHRGGFNMADGDVDPMRALETSLYGNYTYPVAAHTSLSGGLRGSLFVQNGTVYGAIDPSLRVLFDNSLWQLSATYALRHQYLFQTGFSDSGLPTEFWISADKAVRPQYAHEVSLSAGTFLFNHGYRVSADLFYRRLYHQLGYRGSVLDYVNSVYDINSCLMHGNGENYGFSVMLNKCSGPLTGWLHYTYTHARRSFDETGRSGTYPASHERPHELNAVATYTLPSHWSFGGSLVCASGTPFTAAQAVYVLNNNVVVKYGDYNAARFSPYIRLDLSANYRWAVRGRREQGVNLSLYNVTSRENELFYYLRKRDDGSFAYRPVTFVLRVLPSVSYYCKF